MSSPLDGIRVLDLSFALAGPMATQLLAEAGADVVKVEPPQGDPTRGTAAFATWNRSKRGVVLDLDVDADRQQLEQLLAGADVLVHGFGPRRAGELGLDAASLAGRHPRLVSCSVLGYPANHRDAERANDDFLVQARSGLMDEQLGYRDGPIALRFPLPSWAAAYLAAAGILARLLHRRRSGRGGPADTSLVQGLLNTLSLVWNRAERPIPELITTKYDNPPQLAMYRCSDGVWLQIMNPGERIDIPGLPFTRGVLSELGWGDLPVDAEMLSKAFEQRSSAAWLDALRAADVAVEPVLPLGEMLRHPELRANSLLVEVDDPEWGRTTQPAPPFAVAGAPGVRRPAPRLGEHTDEVLAEAARPSVAAMPDVAPSGAASSSRPPLDGMHVLDLGAFLAGPMTPGLLSDLGADVVKVEPLHGDRMRFMARFFEACSRGKRSIAVDLARPEGQEVLARLMRSADVVHHNMRMRAATGLGIDEAGLQRLNPDAVFGYVSAYGLHGDRANWPGFDSVFQAFAGWEHENAGEGNPPQFSRFGTLDVQCALASLVGTMVALFDPERSSRRRIVETSLLSVSAMTQSETLLLADGRLAPYERTDANQTGFSPTRRIFPAHDGWLAVAASTDAQRAALLAVAGVPDAGLLPAAFADRDVDPLLAALEAVGVPAEPVRLQNLNDFFDDEANRAAGLIAGYEHAAFGHFEQPGAYWNFGDLPVKLDRASPIIGQHTREILGELGYAAEQIDALYDAGVVGGPTMPPGVV